MKSGIQKMLAMLIILVTSLGLTGCIFDVSDTDILVKPRLPLELEEISQVLKEHFKEDIQLITPIEGDNKKSVQFIDLDQDGENEVVVLHAKDTDQYAMKVTVLSKKNDKWRINTDIQGIGYDVNKIAFPDLDGDGVKEIIVGWQSGAQLNKGLSVYKHGEKGYEEIYKDSYTEFVTGDLNGNNNEELAIVKLSRSEAFAKAKIFTIVNGEMKLLSENYMDGFINEYATVQIGKVNSQTTGLIVDAKVGARSGFTDVFVLRDNELFNLFFDSKWKVTRETYRQVGRQSADMNNDGIVEIPTLVRANTHETGTNQAPLYITVWNQIDEQDHLKEVQRTYDDLDNGYQVKFPANWTNNVGVVAASQTVTFNWYDSAGRYHSPLLEIKQVNRTEWETTKDKYLKSNYIELGKNLDKVYLAKCFISTDDQVIPLLVDEKLCRELFRIL